MDLLVHAKDLVGRGNTNYNAHLAQLQEIVKQESPQKAEIKTTTLKNNQNDAKNPNTNTYLLIGFKKAPFIPKTETRIFLGGRPIEPANHTERQSFSGQNKQHYQSERANEINPGYGPCRYLGCPYSTDFDIRISIEGNSRN
ncbi:14598_t:CDS:2 [Entrophospora sp. SA101]|nr:14598_t:CDS:2 [Entrophospora sp. SA101]CAJ0917008.1 172_t:CDS:2 [Entrophospora sp. SA101]